MPTTSPAQPLEQAVECFSVTSGWSVMYPGDLTAGRSSYPLHANLPPLPALRRLLQDSGIEAEVIGEQRVVVRRGTPHDFKDSNMSNGTAGAVDLIDHLVGAYDELKRRHGDAPV